MQQIRLDIVELPKLHSTFNDRSLLRVIALTSVKNHLLGKREQVPQPLAQLDVEERSHEASQRKRAVDSGPSLSASA